MIATACEKEPILFDSSSGLVGFSSSALTVTEDGSGDSITLYLGASAGAAASTVSLEVITTGLSNPAVEGTDFSLSSKEVSCAVGETKVKVTPVDNDVFTGDKMFMVKISSVSKYDVAAEDSVMVTIQDNEHPLKPWIGTYDVDADSYGDVLNGEADGAWDEAWTVVTSPVAGALDQLQMVGVGGGDQPVIATLDKDAGTIVIQPDQDAGDCYGYGSTLVYKGDFNLNIVEGASLTGTISPDGTIVVDNWIQYLTDYDFIWDEFKTTWTIQ